MPSHTSEERRKKKEREKKQNIPIRESFPEPSPPVREGGGGGRQPVTPPKEAPGSGFFLEGREVSIRDFRRLKERGPRPEREEERRETRLEAVKAELGTEPLEQELKGKILEQPSLAPEPIIESTEEGLARQKKQRDFTKRLFTGKASKEEIIKEAGNFAIGAGITAGVIGAVFAAPHVAVFAARSAIVKAVTGTGGSVPGLRVAVEALALFAFGGQVLDFRGKEMEVYRGQIQKVIEDGERIEASNKNGFDTTDTIQLLTTISEEVNFAESRIKELGINNFEYRVSKEYLLDQDKVRSARIALERRLEAVVNLAATGQIVIDPQALMLDVAQFK